MARSLAARDFDTRIASAIFPGRGRLGRISNSFLLWLDLPLSGGEASWLVCCEVIGWIWILADDGVNDTRL